MEIFLSIAAGIFVGFLLIVLTIYLFIRFWLRRVFKQFTDAIGEFNTGITPFMQPLRITLDRETMPEWNDKPAVNRVVRPLRANGFVDAGVFTLAEVEDVQVQALAQAETAVYAVVYEHPDKGVWFELVSRYEDGTSVSFSTAEETGLDRPPNRVVERYAPDTDSATVYQQHLMRRPDEPLLPALPEGFKRDFERAYAADMDWRFERGGFTQDEIRNNLKLLGSDTTDQQVKHVHAMQQAQVNEWLQTKLAENYRTTAKIPEKKWRKMEHQLIFVHDRLSSDEVHGMFTTWLDWDDDAADETAEEAEKLAEEGPARVAFARMIEMLSADRTPKKIGHLTQPVAADVYLGAEDILDEYE